MQVCIHFLCIQHLYILTNYACTKYCVRSFFRYFVRTEIQRPTILQSVLRKERTFMVINESKQFPAKTVHMQVGVDDCLHIKFSYKNVHLPIDGCLEGSITILSNRLKIQRMEIQFIRREVAKNGYQNFEASPLAVHTEVLGKFEVMDGFPADGEVIPLRMFLQQFSDALNVTQANKHFSVRYYVNLGLVDCDGRRYFKTCELIIFRQPQKFRIIVD